MVKYNLICIGWVRLGLEGGGVGGVLFSGYFWIEGIGIEF